ncbi:MAG: diguanylate cyclase [Burkholderiaceae bacterium]
MFFRRRPAFPSSDVFPVTDTTNWFDDTSDQRPARRQTDAQPRSRSRWVVPGLLIGLYALAWAGAAALGVLPLELLWWVAGMSAAGCAGFSFAFHRGWHLASRDPQWRLHIVTAALAGLLVLLYLEPASQILLAPFAFVAFAWGLFTTSQRGLLCVAAALVLGYGVITGVHYAEQRNEALLRLELMHLLALTLALPAFIVLMAKVQRLYRRLHQASRKIRSIEQDAQRDTLLGCYNRRYILAALEQQKQLADEGGLPLCLAVLDIDHFKRINDSIGHLAGDEVLRQFARIAQQNVRGGDVFGRYGGEEFLLIFPGTALLPALNTCERIRAHVEAHAWDAALPAPVTVSIGVTQYVVGESLLEFFSRADTAMYLAKEGGRNQVVVEEPVSRQDSQDLDSSQRSFF